MFELLDFPIAMGRGEDIVLVGSAPEKPLVNGREVTDPRLVAALKKPIELDRAEVLDRSAKLAGIFRAMGLDPRTARLTIDSDVPQVARALSILAAARIGMVVHVPDTEASESRGDNADSTGAAGDLMVRIHQIETTPTTSSRASVKVVRSRFEGVGITVDSHTANLDQAMRDSRVESAEVVPLAPDMVLIHTVDDSIDAEAAVTWLAEKVLTGVQN